MNWGLCIYISSLEVYVYWLILHVICIMFGFRFRQFLGATLSSPEDEKSVCIRNVVSELAQRRCNKVCYELVMVRVKRFCGTTCVLICPVLPDTRKSTLLCLKVPRLVPFVLLSTMMKMVGANGTSVLGEKHVSQLWHGPARDRTVTSAIRARRLTVWAMERPKKWSYFSTSVSQFWKRSCFFKFPILPACPSCKSSV